MGKLIRKTAKDTLTPIELNCGDAVEFTLYSGKTCAMELVSTSAQATKREGDLIREYTFSCVISVNGQLVTINRYIPTQESFYKPLEVEGMLVWFDAVSDIFQNDGGFLLEKDEDIGIVCQPKAKARFALMDAEGSICPEPPAKWYPEPNGFIDVNRCYRGEDTWMGPYDGLYAHGGLDINMPSGTPLYAPISFDDHFLFNSLEAGDINNRWRGIRKWDNGSVWWLQAHHLNEMVLNERGPLEKGNHFANTAGVHAGVHEHTHFVFRVFEDGKDYFLDPWILFYHIFKDNVNLKGITIA